MEGIQMSTPETPTPRIGSIEIPLPTKRYVPAVSPRLRKWLYVIFALVALLGANAAYLGGITALEAITKQTYQDYFYQFMFLVHLVLGLLLIVPFVVFGVFHMLAARNRRNGRAVRIGYALFGAGVVVLVTGVLLMRIGDFNIRDGISRNTVYWLHVIVPLAAAWLYWLHRLAGPRIKWKIGLSYLGAVAGIVGVMILLRSQDP